MKSHLAIGFAWFSTAAAAFCEPTQREFMDHMNRIQVRINGGEIDALNELTAYTGKWATPAFLIIFKQNYNVNGATALNKSIGTRCAQLLTTTPGGEDYLIKLLKDTDENIPNDIYYQQATAIKCMLLVNQKFGVRVLSSGLNDNEIGGKAANALATLNLPDAPYLPNNKTGEANKVTVPKWKAWWEAHKDSYIEKGSSPATTP